MTAPGQERHHRRRVLLASGTIGLILGGVVILGLFAMLWRSLLGRSPAEDAGTVTVGTLEDFEPESVNEEFSADLGFWVVRSSGYDGIDSIFALRSECTDPGCAPDWDPDARSFACPCDGSRFAISGDNLDGPAPGRPLERFRVERTESGLIRVDTSRTYREEIGQWADPGSLIRP